MMKRASICGQFFIEFHLPTFTMLSSASLCDYSIFHTWDVLCSQRYTNALVSSTLGFALDAAAVLNESVGANWSSIAARPYLPLRTDLLGQDRPIHSQDKQYKKGQMITQSDVGLLQYPLEV